MQAFKVCVGRQSLTGGGGGGGGEVKELRGGRDQLKMEMRKGREGVDYLAGDRWEAKGDAAPGGGWEGEEEEGGRGLEDVSKSKHWRIRSRHVRQVTQGRRAILCVLDTSCLAS